MTEICFEFICTMFIIIDLSHLLNLCNVLYRLETRHVNKTSSESYCS